MIAKLITYDLDRDGASEYEKSGERIYHSPLKAAIPLYIKAMDDEEFQKETYNIGYIVTFLPDDEDEDQDEVVPSGNKMLISKPWPVLIALMVPPCFSIIFLVMANPSPPPLFSVGSTRKKGSKILSMSSFDI